MCVSLWILISSCCKSTDCCRLRSCHEVRSKQVLWLCYSHQRSKGPGGIYWKGRFALVSHFRFSCKAAWLFCSVFASQHHIMAGTHGRALLTLRGGWERDPRKGRVTNIINEWPKLLSLCLPPSMSTTSQQCHRLTNQAFVQELLVSVHTGTHVPQYRCGDREHLTGTVMVVLSL